MQVANEIFSFLAAGIIFVGVVASFAWLFMDRSPYSYGESGPDEEELEDEGYEPGPEDQACDVLDEVFAEYQRAISLHPSAPTEYHALAVLQEEAYELQMEVYSNASKNPDRLANMRKEAIQTAVTAIRFVVDVCDKPTEVQ